MRLTYLISEDYVRTTGGWVYNERLLQELAALGWQIDRIELAAGFPEPAQAAIDAALQVLAELPQGVLVLADQVVLSPLVASLPARTRGGRFAMLMHHPQVLEASRPAAVAERLDGQERTALALMDCVIATSRLTAGQMTSSYAVDAAKLVTAEPGTDPQPASPGSGGTVTHLLSLGSVIPRKRQEMIVAALAGLKDLDWHLNIAGNLGMNAPHVAMMQRLIDAHGLGSRIVLLGELTGAELARLWRGTDLYVASSRHEGFGMAVAEAVARAIPVVSTRSGAVGSWLDPRASLLVEPDDAETLRAALRRVLVDRELRVALRAGAMQARTALPTWPQCAALVSRALASLAG